MIRIGTTCCCFESSSGDEVGSAALDDKIDEVCARIVPLDCMERRVGTIGRLINWNARVRGEGAPIDVRLELLLRGNASGNDAVEDERR